MDGVHRRNRPRVAVVVRISEQRSVLIEEAVVDRPRVEPDADQIVGRPGRLTQAGEDLAIEAEDVPMEAVRQATSGGDATVR